MSMSSTAPTTGVTPTNSESQNNTAPSTVPTSDDDKFFCMVQSLPKHETVKLKASTYTQWQQQLKLLLNAYGLTGYVDGSVVSPPMTVLDFDGRSVSNPLYTSFVQQDQLLAHWLLSTVSGELLTSFSGTSTAREI